MYLFPTDESGNTGWNLDSPDQPLHFLLTLGIHEDKSAILSVNYSGLHWIIFHVRREIRILNFREIKRLLDTVHFVKSQDSRLIQLADCSSYLICRYHNLNMKPPANITVSDKEIIRLHKLLESTKGGILKRISP